ncbi:vomeronasal 1 receptor ornAnaV1R3024 [Ornithorhynchus anatinus]|uniref:vomeronasal 1 receptor ornAnaV1R3024 n=1 Tax=Ornithorhynchus anatinus TaxID=9258 RepID=UPI0001555673|nr:vomeronasal 1 receptor ornAnaV1R3024 [Ornithorhynchus anatinus]
MDVSDISLGSVMLLEIGTGVSGNVFLLLFYAHMAFSRHKLSSSDLILTHLALVNIIMLLTYGIPEIISAWGWKNFLDTAGCKIILYIYRVGRDLVICTTCLLSIFQAITISPGTSRWAGVKAKLPKYILPSFVVFWVLNLLIDVNSLVYVTGPQNSTTVLITFDLKYCSITILSAEAALLNAIMLSGRDLSFLGLMSLASGYMVFVLYGHHRRVRHLHGPGGSPRTMPEVQAAKRVITLVTLYVLLYGRQSIMFSVLLKRKEKSPLLVKIHMVMSFGFPVISPFLVILSDRRTRTFWKRQSTISTVDSS